MNNRDITSLFTWSDIGAALGLLTRLPLRVDTDAAMARGAMAAWAYPVVGFVIAVCAVIGAMAAYHAGLPPAICAIFVIIIQTGLTGAMHEDGLADTADGFWGGWDTSRRLEIMKDSHIGTYGVLAVIFGFALRVAAITALIANGDLFAPVVAAAMISRAAMVAVMHAMPHARADGLSSSVGQPRRATALAALAIAAGAAFIFAGIAAVTLLVFAGIATCVCMFIARAKIGGQTGDVLGATQQITEITVLLTVLSHVAG